MKYWWLNLLRYALPEWRGLMFIGLATLAGIGMKLIAPWPLKLIVDYALVKKPLPEDFRWVEAIPGAGSAQGLLAWLAMATVALFLAKRSAKIASDYVRSGTSNRMVYRLATDLFQHLQNRSLIFHGNQHVGDLVRRVTTDCSCVRDLVMCAYLPLITALVTLVSMLWVMWQLSPTVAIFALLLTVPLGLISRYFASPLSEQTYRVQHLQGELMSLAEQTLTAVPLVKAFGREETENQRFRDLARRNIGAIVRALVCQQQFNVTTNLLTTLATASVMLVGGWSVLQGSLTVGSLLVLIAYFRRRTRPSRIWHTLVRDLPRLGPGRGECLRSSNRITIACMKIQPPVPCRSGRARAAIFVWRT